MSIPERIRRLVAILREEDLDEIEVRTLWNAVRVVRRRHVAPSTDAPGRDTPLRQGSAASSDAAAGAEPPTEQEQGGPVFDQILSPMVGTFYRASSPEAEPFVSEGSEVGLGQVLCIIEAMKLMNEIEAERSGVIRRILVEDAQPVEFGQPLFLIE
jgi:acetyl-CoA carboxylase biotin carboxyl carrier protein